MSNLRIITNNVIGDADTLTATSEALAVENLQTNYKSEVWRSTALTATVTATFTAAQTVSGVAFPFTNFSATATMQVKLYTNVADGSPVYDSTAILCCPFDMQGINNFGVNYFAYGGSRGARIWTPSSDVKKVEVIITDTSNTSSYIEAGVMVIGEYFEPSSNFSYGATSGIADTSTSKRTDAGDKVSNQGTRHKVMSLSFNHMDATDRDNFIELLSVNGTTTPFFISAYPENTDKELENDHQMYAVLSQADRLSRPYYDAHSTSLSVEEI